MDIRVGRGGFSLLGGDGGYQEAGGWMDDEGILWRIFGCDGRRRAATGGALALGDDSPSWGSAFPGVGGRGQNVLGRQCSG